MIKKKEIQRITKGWYTIHEDPELAVFCFKPAYLGLQDALSVHNLWEQETNPLIITTKKIRPGIRKIFDSNVMIRRISNKYFFGFEYVKRGDFYVPVSDIEKTFIDMIYFKQKLDKDLMKNFRKRLDQKKLKEYLDRYPKRIQQMTQKNLTIQDFQGKLKGIGSSKDLQKRVKKYRKKANKDAKKRYESLR